MIVQPPGSAQNHGTLGAEKLTPPSLVAMAALGPGVYEWLAGFQASCEVVQ
ncbi:MAG TPA: hypothetical protein VF989_17260 [Polyangiaceae bacterium]